MEAEPQMTGERIISAAVFAAVNNPEDTMSYMRWFDTLTPDAKVFVYEHSDTIQAIAQAWPRIGQKLMEEVVPAVLQDTNMIRMSDPSKKMEYLRIVYTHMQQRLYDVLVENIHLPEWLATELATYMPETWLAPVFKIVWK